MACYRNDALGVGFAGIVSKRWNRAYGNRAMSAQELPAMRCAEETSKQCRERTMSAPLSGRINIGSICAITMAIFAIFMLSTGIAHAQFLFWPQYRFWPGHYAPFKHKHHHRQTNSESAKNARPEGRHRMGETPLLSIETICESWRGARPKCVRDHAITDYDRGRWRTISAAACPLACLSRSISCRLNRSTQHRR